VHVQNVCERTVPRLRAFMTDSTRRAYLRVELAVALDAFVQFKAVTYYLEADTCVGPFAYDRLLRLHEHSKLLLEHKMHPLLTAAANLLAQVCLPLPYG